jgi:hypothetical protein
LEQEPEVAEIRKFSRRAERAKDVERLRLDDACPASLLQGNHPAQPGMSA